LLPINKYLGQIPSSKYHEDYKAIIYFEPIEIRFNATVFILFISKIQS